MDWTLKFRGDEPLYAQLRHEIEGALSAGRLRPGERLPSVVELARRLKVSKITVLKAFEELERKGAIVSQVGRGTFVAHVPAGAPAKAGAPAAEPRPEVTRSVRKLRETYARGLRELLSLDRPPGTLSLAAGVPHLDSVPDGTLERLAKAALARNPRRLHEFFAAGLPELRDAVAARHPGVLPEQVLVTNGSQQALNLLACWALEEGRPVACETPTFTGVPGSFQIVGHAVESVPWGETPAGRALLYVCPDFHNPTGQTLPEEARRAIADWALRQDGLVVTDEIFRDLRFTGQAPPSLWSLLPAGRRVLVGSLSKTFMTGLRAGFLIADRPLAGDLLAYKRYMDLGGPALTQAIAAEFLRDGYDAHLARMREHYRVRRDAVLKALAAMPEGVTWTKPEGGFQMWVTMPRGLSSIQLYLLALERGVAISPGPAHDIDGRFVNCFRIGYGHLAPEQLKDAVGRLAGAVKTLLKQGRVESATGLGIHV